VRTGLKTMKVKGLYHYQDGARVDGPHQNMSGDVSDLTGNCTGLMGDCTGLKGAVSGLTGDISGLSGAVSGLWGDVSDLSGDVSELEGDVSDLTGDISGLSGDISGLMGDCTGLMGDCTDLEGDVSGLKGKGTVRQLMHARDAGAGGGSYPKSTARGSAVRAPRIAREGEEDDMENDHDGDITPGLNTYLGDEPNALKPPPLPASRPRWCASGQRWDEECDGCGRESVLDNNTSLCERCYNRHY
jgi:hypothetical protein